ncbi:hypothetical protein [Lysobacter gummosus]|uniref:hypothetical protein n=1 Tax=Lysobacter gummosus TaxID=262324 RepID=UPI00363BE410
MTRVGIDAVRYGFDAQPRASRRHAQAPATRARRVNAPRSSPATASTPPDCAPSPR